MTKEEIDAIIIEANGADDGSEVAKAGKFLLAYASAAPSMVEIARLASATESEVDQWMVKAQNAGLIIDGKLHHGGWFDEEDGGVAFILDAMCVAGLLERSLT